MNLNFYGPSPFILNELSNLSFDFNGVLVVYSVRNCIWKYGFRYEVNVVLNVPGG